MQSERRTVCVLFLDIRGFTAMTRTRSADETVTLLNDFFAEMIEIVDRHNGFINKFLGDGFLALFGAALADPAAAANALAAGREHAEGGRCLEPRRIPGAQLKVGIGIHIGEAITGSIGSPRRKEYTAIGDTVNLAARLEQLTKETGARLLLSEPVRKAADSERCRRSRRRSPIRGYERAGAGLEAAHDLVLRLRLEHESGAARRPAAEGAGGADGPAHRRPARRLAAGVQQGRALARRRRRPATSSRRPARSCTAR